MPGASGLANLRRNRRGAVVSLKGDDDDGDADADGAGDDDVENDDDDEL